ncbi:cytochrome P450 [Glomus cerebriforme]|uniref:Cytochrome P450 n=1 Tax=Glomus cerebriforme TaxID=658196 RepID=A0A397SE53_9GLOM|nr:cytochrome P450 [Glomus cerebriforme]
MVILMDYLQILGFGLIFVISAILLKKKSRAKLNEPPLVSYKFPIIGHTFDYYKDVQGFLAKCRDEYGEIFSLYMWGTVQTYVGKTTYSEVYKNHHTFDFNKAMEDIMPMHHFLNRPEGFLNDIDKYAREFMSDLDKFAERVQKNLNKSYNEFIGDGKVIRSPLKVIQQIISRPIAATIVGEELCNDNEILDSFANMTADLVPLLSFPPILNFIYPGLHQKFLIFKFKYFNNPIRTHRSIILSKIITVINKRINDKNRLRNSWKRPDDILQELTERFMIDENTVDIDSVADFIINFIFASVHTTSFIFTQCLYDYVNNPEYHEELLEEATSIYNKYKDTPYYTIDKIAEMDKLDNFIKETLRTNINATSMFRKTVSDFTFLSGYQVPKGRTIQTMTQHIHFDPKSYGPDPKKFNPYRHINSQSTRPERDYVAFGIGKTVCPGRFFAINEIKVAMHFMQLRYKIRSVSGNRVEPIVFAGFIFPNDEGLIFEKREDSVIQEF